jgi:hemoglobin-like flavoprotein
VSPENQQRIIESWRRIEEEPDRFARAFYSRLFDADPQIRSLFGATDITAHRQKFADMLRHLVAALDDPPDLVATLAASGRRHAEYGVGDAHYPVVGGALLGALEDCLGADLDTATRHAWRELFTFIAAIMRRGAEQVRTAGGQVERP